ncbi:MAG: hypothetical protein ABIQ51_23560 [Mesorhizobium sp.]
MKNGKSLVVVIASLLLGATGWYSFQTIASTQAEGPAGAAPAPQAQHVQTVAGEEVVAVADDVQRASHMDVTPLTASEVHPERTAYATVVNVQPLFDLRYRIAATQEDVEGAQAAIGISRAQLQRDETLMTDSHNISEKTLQDARAAVQADQDKLDAANAVEDGLAASLRLQFGETIANAATTPSSALLRKLSGGQAVLLLVSLPADGDASAPAEIAVDDTKGHRIPASKISVSPQADPSLQGNPYLYMADRAIPAGTHMIAHVPIAGENIPGVLIPESALLWYSGQRWAYLKTGPESFTRRLVQPAATVDGGLIVRSGFGTGDELVTQGAQLLLSEELKPQGIATQCKDPPECDD